MNGRWTRGLVIAAMGTAVLSACTTEGPGAPDRPAGSESSGANESGTGSEGGADVEKLNKVLLAAASEGDAAGAREAVKAGADVEARDGEGRTALFTAVIEDHVDVAEVLVEHGADPDAPDSRGESPWVNTGVTGSVAMMELLLPLEPDLAQYNRFGGTALHPASERGHVDYVREVLAQSDIPVDRVNDLGWTALLEAVYFGDGGTDHQEIVRLLVDAGADASIEDSSGLTALDHARAGGYDEIVRILED
ncbi:ankyrin repeat domain-containing protein [Salininema proteolyticum]|uniref:Ankyrin repeat domain-containing protein n=1 Tax=Salininema proteolyticum TaxID=1607685 RepID=A0ABV8TZ15_9ACTN